MYKFVSDRKGVEVEAPEEYLREEENRRNKLLKKGAKNGSKVGTGNSSKSKDGKIEGEDISISRKLDASRKANRKLIGQ